MRCNFEVGQKVLCVDDTSHIPIAIMDGLKKGVVYTIRDIGEIPDWQVNNTIFPEGESVGVRLVEIDRRRKPNPFVGPVEEAMYDSRRFRPLQSRETNISVFTDILAKVPETTDA